MQAISRTHTGSGTRLQFWSFFRSGEGYTWVEADA